jgi:hypothetical protein
MPNKGYTAYLVELTYENNNTIIPWYFSTENFIIPESQPCN